MKKQKERKKFMPSPTAKVLLIFVLINLMLTSLSTLTGCSSSNSDSAPPQTTDLSLSYRADDDPELEMATARARLSFSTFRKAFNARKKGDFTDFQVKFPTTVADITEFFWMDVTSLDGDKISGTYYSDGIDIPSIHKNDPVSVSVSKINDWVFDDGTVAKGGFSVPLFEKEAIEQLNNIDSSSPEKAVARKEELLAHWKDLEAQAKSPKQIEMYKTDFETLKRIQHCRRLHKGNTGTEASVKEIAKIYDMPEEFIQSTENFYEAWKNRTRGRSAVHGK